MITLFRNFAKSKWAVGLFALIILSFVVVGAQSDIFSNLGPRHVVSAGDRSINGPEFRNSFERVRANVSEQSGQTVTFEQIAAEGYVEQYLQEQTMRMGFAQWAWNVGIRPGKDLIVAEIRKIPAFFNSITGAFDQTQYQQALAQQNFTTVMFENELRDQYTIQHFGTALVSGVRLPKAYAAIVAASATETRDGAWFTVTQAMAGSAKAPTDEQLNAFMKENEAQLRIPEFRTVSLVLFTPGPNDARPAITEEQLRERYEFRKDSLSEAEKRTFTLLTVPSREAADKVAAELRAGKDVNEVAASVRIQPTPYNDTPRTALGDAKIADAVFALPAAGVTDPIQGTVGYTVAKITAIQGGKDVSFESARADLTTELQAEAVQKIAYERVKAFEDARTAGKSIADAVTASGARLAQLPPFTRQGQLPNGQPYGLPPVIIETAYALTKGGESDVITAGEGEYIALRVDDVREAALPKLDELRPMLTQNWIARENSRLLNQKADELAGRLRAGEDITAVAASVNATVMVRTNVTRDAAAQQAHGAAALTGLFSTAKDQAFSTPGENGFVIGKVNAIHAANPVTAAALVAPIGQQLATAWGNEVVQTALTAAAAKVKAKSNATEAYLALGIEAPVAGAAPAAPAPAPAK